MNPVLAAACRPSASATIRSTRTCQSPGYSRLNRTYRSLPLIRSRVCGSSYTTPSARVAPNASQSRASAAAQYASTAPRSPAVVALGALLPVISVMGTSVAPTTDSRRAERGGPDPALAYLPGSAGRDALIEYISGMRGRPAG